MNREYLNRLTRYLELEYEVQINEIRPAKRGFFGETWKLVTDKGEFFVKIDYWEYHKRQYQQSLTVTQYITDSGIDFVPRLIKTSRGQLFGCFHQGVVAVYEYVPGENHEDYSLELLFEHLARLYRLGVSQIEGEKESFGAGAAQELYELRDSKALPMAITGVLNSSREKIDRYAGGLEYFSQICQKNLTDFRITHGDAGGNCILEGERFYIVDWDSVKLAPIERDAWFYIGDSSRIQTINRVLSEQGLDYQLKPERLCYYCYHSFFYYLTEYLKSFLCAHNEQQKQSIIAGLTEYLEHSWIYKRLDVADRFRGVEIINKN